MSEEEDKKQIRKLIECWMKATSEGNTERILRLIAEDVVFLQPGQPPMLGRDAFAKASQAVTGKMVIKGSSDIQEIQVTGDFAFCWNQLSLDITPLDGTTTIHKKGPVLSVFRREEDGRWVLFRDANMLT